MYKKPAFILHAATATVLSMSLASCKDEPLLPGSGDSPPKENGGPHVADEAQAFSIDQQLSFARQELAERLKIEPGEIQVESVRTVHWRSGAAGCPEPGMSYTMAIVPGVLILLKADGETYRYHAGVSRAPFYCPAARAEAPAYGMGEEAM